MTVVEIKEAIRALTPEEQRELLAFAMKLSGYTGGLAESALAKDWDRPEEDAAWANLGEEQK